MKEREELFEDWVSEREKAAREAKKAEKKKKRAAFRQLLESSRCTVKNSMGLTA